MPKSRLETKIEKAASDFAMSIVEAVKSSTLEELLELQTGGKPARKKPGPKPGPKRKPGRPPKAKKVAAAKPAKKKRVVKNYPKCAYPRCNNNRFPRGKGFCGKHWHMWKEGKIKDAEFYLKGGAKKKGGGKKKGRGKKK